MKSTMRVAIMHLKVARIIVQQISVNVMTNLSPGKVATKLVLKDQAVLKHHAILVAARMIWRVLNHIARVVYSSMTTPIRWSGVRLPRPSGWVHVNFSR